MNSPILVRVVGKNEATVACEAVVNIPGVWYLDGLLDSQAVEALEALAGVLEDADRYYQHIRRPSLSKAACSLRERVIDQIVAAGASVPRARVGAEKRFVS